MPSGTEPSSGSFDQFSNYPQTFYRLPASQPTSPVRGTGQAQIHPPYSAHALGRQRGATFSGSTPQHYYYHESSDPYDTNYSPAVPAHLAFTAIRSPSSHSSIAPSPVTTTVQSRLQEEGYYANAAAAQLNAALGVGAPGTPAHAPTHGVRAGGHETLMGEAVATPTQFDDSSGVSSESGVGSAGISGDAALSNEMIDRFALLDRLAVVQLLECSS